MGSPTKSKPITSSEPAARFRGESGTGPSAQSPRQTSINRLTGSSFRSSGAGGSPYGSFSSTARDPGSRASNFTSNSPADLNFKSVPPSSQLSASHTSALTSQLRSGSPRPASNFSNHPSNNNNDGEDSLSPAQSVDVNNPELDVVERVGRHLVQPKDVEQPPEDGRFSSLQLQGGDITRELYNWQQQHDREAQQQELRRVRSASLPHRGSEGTLIAHDLRVPGAFRRDFIQSRKHDQSNAGFLTRNFIEFINLYGHFAGEELEDEDEFEPEEGEGEHGEGGAEEAGLNEESALLRASAKKRLREAPPANTTATKAVMLLLKSFVGTGVLFLPHAFLNGGMLFSTAVLIAVASISYYCFILLIASRIPGVSSYGDIGGHWYGPAMRHLILFSIAISQIGFSAAYIVFTSENLQAVIYAVSNHTMYVAIEKLIALQLIIFLPLSLIRKIHKLSGTALIADFFILLGILFLYYWSGMVVATQGVADIVYFNSKDWNLFLGTAIFTFEGIGLVIPIQESMKKPQQFPAVLVGVMLLITTIFVSIGALCYAAFGSKVQTVVLLNFPQDNRAVNGIQFIYSVAILLSTPLQLFPAIRIIENACFVRSGKYNYYIKWQKNIFRCIIVAATALISWAGAADLDKFVSFIGSFACIPLVYIYPPLLHFKSPHANNLTKPIDVFLVVFGVVMMVYTTGLTLASWFF